MVAFSTFYKQFLEWLPVEKRYSWKKSIVLDYVKQHFPVGAYTNNKRMIGNLSLEAKTADPKAGPWISVNNWMVKQDCSNRVSGETHE
jgi:hypothetical protein